MKRERVKNDLHMMSKVLFMSSVKDVNNLSAGDLVSNSPEESPCSAILFFLFCYLLRLYFYEVILILYSCFWWWCLYIEMKFASVNVFLLLSCLMVTCLNRGTNCSEDVRLPGVCEVSGGSRWNSLAPFNQKTRVSIEVMARQRSQEKNTLKDRVTCSWREVHVLVTVTVTVHNGWPAISLPLLTLPI